MSGSIETQTLIDGKKFHFDDDDREFQGLTVNYGDEVYPGWLYDHSDYRGYSPRSLSGRRLPSHPGRLPENNYVPRKMLSFDSKLFIEILHADDDFEYMGYVRKPKSMAGRFVMNVLNGLLMRYPLKDIIGFSVFCLRTDKRCPKLFRMPKKYLPYG